MANAAKALESIKRKDIEKETAAKVEAMSKCIKVSTNMTGKLLTIPCIGTSCADNKICQARIAAGDSVCAHCYAAATANMYAALRRNLLMNMLVLSERPLDVHTAARAAAACAAQNDIARIEHFGDVDNVMQASNYLRIIKAGAAMGVHFGVWTKNPSIWDAAIKLEGRPENATFIQSSRRINEIDDVNYGWIDCTFTVYSDSEAMTEAVKRGSFPCSCGERACHKCRHCYSYRRQAGEPVRDIAELLRK